MVRRELAVVKALEKKMFARREVSGLDPAALDASGRGLV